MIDYADILIEAYRDNELQVIDILSEKQLLSIKKGRIECVYIEWFLSKAQIVERDYFIEPDSFIDNCLKHSLCVLQSFKGKKDNKIIYFGFMFTALCEMSKAIKQEDRLKPTLLTIYGKNETKLTNFHYAVVEAKLIASDLESWLYWFVGKPCGNPQQIKWLTKRTELRYFINKICPDLESKETKFPLINEVFALINGRQIDSNDKITKNATSNTRLIDSLI
jgi:hypothetical protein